MSYYGESVVFGSAKKSRWLTLSIELEEHASRRDERAHEFIISDSSGHSSNAECTHPWISNFLSSRSS